MTPKTARSRTRDGENPPAPRRSTSGPGFARRPGGTRGEISVLPSPKADGGMRLLRGALESIDSEGRIRVRIGNHEPMHASFVLGETHGAILEHVRARASVLVAWAEGAPPIVVGIIRQTLSLEDAAAARLVEPCVEVRATERLSLVCGGAAIELTRDGRIDLRGAEVVTESAGAVKIKGGHVDIN